MNIFILHEHPGPAAQMQADKHVVKMVLESAQMLCTAHRVMTPKIEYPHQYRKTHENHPCNKWIRESAANYMWLLDHFISLTTEYKYRYHKSHLCSQKFLYDTDWIFMPPTNVPDIGLTPFAQAMPDEYKNDDAVKAYRDYYFQEKILGLGLVYNKARPMPNWIHNRMLELVNES
jgi:hypothetical protein